MAAKELRSHLSEADVESTQALVAAVEAKDPLTRSHSLAVATYASTIGRWLGLSDRAVSSLWSAGLLHDVGKIGVPDAILTKPGPLTQEEFAVVQRHPRTATQILEPISTLHRERALILHHHERYDGTGYPSGLARERIPMGARVLAVADSLDTMLSPRAYKPRYSMERARCELTTGAGRQFDARVVDVTLSWLDEAATELTAHADS